jgi:nitroimidazol reductase NimA-like FMN-containing flavoprotein (pyridoxamine 5'-phosphate oxidase superfamily)
MTSDGLEVLDEAECYSLLRSHTLGRVAVHLADDLAIFPVFYAMMQNDVVFRTSPGTKLSAAVLGTRVVFEVDNESPAWSVFLRGHAHEIRHHDEQEHARSLLGKDWPDDPRHYYVKITAEQLTGRRLSGKT